MAGETLFDKIERLSMTLERMQLDKYLAFVSDKKRMLIMAFLGGMARGVGFMFGFSTIGAIAVYILIHVILRNIPGIGEFLTEVLNEVSIGSR
ncbi:MAG: hypothetical protein IKJ65_06160 [Clostridia bacterium]|nr:hypothetical protein [Clostridia bacterium]